MLVRELVTLHPRWLCICNSQVSNTTSCSMGSLAVFCVQTLCKAIHSRMRHAVGQNARCQLLSLLQQLRQRLRNSSAPVVVIVVRVVHSAWLRRRRWPWQWERDRIAHSRGRPMPGQHLHFPWQPVRASAISHGRRRCTTAPRRLELSLTKFYSAFSPHIIWPTQINFES